MSTQICVNAFLTFIGSWLCKYQWTKKLGKKIYPFFLIVYMNIIIFRGIVSVSRACHSIVEASINEWRNI